VGTKRKGSTPQGDGAAKKVKVGQPGGGGKPRRGKPSVGNTATFPYLDSKAVTKHCDDEKKAIDQQCKPESDDAKTRRMQGKGGLLGKLKLPKKPDSSAKPGGQWIADHCEFLMFKPRSATEMFSELENLPGQMAQQMGTKALEAAHNKAKEVLEKAVEKKLAKMGAKQLAGRVGSFLGGPWTGIGVNIAMTASGAHDMATALEELPDLKGELDSARRALDDATQKVKEAQSALDRYKKADGSLNADALISDTMEGAARTNPCITARRCQLVPYNQTQNPAALNGKGCCPGQTGHHVLPSAMFEHCDNYNSSQAANAPTICVEGATNSHGSHGRIHGGLKRVLERDYPNIPYGAAMPSKDATQAGVDSVQEIFPESKCSEKCLKAQLDDYYKKLNCKPKKANGFSSNGKSSSIGTTKE
jgi:GHH signature containing HNH/Endo VII superfamily nuclease toxin  2